MYINGKKVMQFIKTDAVNVDDALSETSENAVQNKVVTAELNKKLNESNLLDKQYPVGAIYMSEKTTSPASLFGGTWEQLKDRFLLGAGDTYSNGDTGGSADAVVVAHSHPLLYGTSSSSNQTIRVSGFGVAGVSTSGSSISSTGVSGTGKNMPPYLVVYMWKRVG